MSAALHAPATSPQEAQEAAPAPTPPTVAPIGSRRCPECLAPVVGLASAGFSNMFCSAAHRTAHANRMTVRGRRLTSVAMAARITRDGSCRMKDTGKAARRLSRALMDRWIVEDREAGRMPADEYHALRVRLGHDRAAWD